MDRNMYQGDLLLLVAIVNYRTGKLTADCLHSLAPEVSGMPRTIVVVADNDSGDDSISTINNVIKENDWSSWACVIELERNGGFAYGNNAIIAIARDQGFLPKYVLLLNPDTVVRPGSLKSLVDFMDINPHAGIAGSRLEDLDGTPQRSAFRFPTFISEFEGTIRLGIISKIFDKWVVAPPAPTYSCKVDWVAGASMIIRYEVIDTIGLMDETFFLYYEEVEYCWRAHRAGWECWYNPESKVVHLVGQSSGVTDNKRPKRRRPAYWFNSRRRFFTKCYGPVYSCFADFLWIVGYATWSIRQKMLRRKNPDPPYFFLDFINNRFTFWKTPLKSN